MQQQQPSSGPGFSQALNGLLFVSRALAVTVEVFLHRSSTFGARYLGLQAAIGMILVFFFPVFWPQHDATPLLYFLAAFVAMCAAARIATVRRRFRGEHEPHSYYSGAPRLLRQSSRMSECSFKGVVEPAIVWLVGLMVMDWSEPLGSYLVCAGVALMISVGAAVLHERVRALDMNDALIEQKQVSDRWRGMRPH
jgi:hypothetical protein